jgi:hypothetical protein
MRKRYFFNIHFYGREEMIGAVTLVSHNEETAYKEAIDYAKSKVDVDLICVDDEE